MVCSSIYTVPSNSDCIYAHHVQLLCLTCQGAFFAPFLVEAHSIHVVTVGSILACVNVIATIATLHLPETLGKKPVMNQMSYLYILTIYF